VACGGDDDSGGSSDEDQVVSVIETAATSTAPEDCTKLQTQAFMEQSTFQTGADAVSKCEQDAPDEDGSNPDSVEVSDVSVDGSRATATAAFTGGSFDGSTVTLSLVKDGDQWKLDQITEVVELNAEAVRSAFASQLEASQDLDETQKACVSDSFATATDEQLKGLLLGDATVLQELFGAC
jgi:hypothetical protein